MDVVQAEAVVVKRSRMPQRTSPLRTKTPLERTSRLRSSGPIKAKRPRPSAAEKLARRLVDVRSEGYCELRLPGCAGIAIDFSHRIARGRGGLWTASDGMASCRPCHMAITDTNGKRAEYERLGLICRTGADTTQVPVRIHGRGFVLLTDDGQILDIQPSDLDQQKGA